MKIHSEQEKDECIKWLRENDNSPMDVTSGGIFCTVLYNSGGPASSAKPEVLRRWSSESKQMNAILTFLVESSIHEEAP